MAKKSEPAVEKTRAQMLTMGQGAPVKETNDGGQADDQTDAADDGAADSSAQADGDGE